MLDQGRPALPLLRRPHRRLDPQGRRELLRRPGRPHHLGASRRGAGGGLRRAVLGLRRAGDGGDQAARRRHASTPRASSTGARRRSTAPAWTASGSPTSCASSTTSSTPRRRRSWCATARRCTSTCAACRREPIYWRRRGDTSYKPFTAADYEALRKEFAASGEAGSARPVDVIRTGQKPLPPQLALWPWQDGAGSKAPETRKETPMKFGIFYEHQLPRPWHAAQRVRAAQQLAGADRAGRSTRLRLRLGGRASLPRGVLALVGARGLPRGGEPAHEADPPGARHHPAHDESSRARGRAREHARSAEPRPRRVRHRRGLEHHRAPSLRPSLPRQARGVGRRGPRGDPDVHRARRGSITASTSTSRCATCCRSRCRSRIRRSGWRARSSRPSRWRGGAAWVRSASSSSRPKRRTPGSTPTTTPS